MAPKPSKGKGAVSTSRQGQKRTRTGQTTRAAPAAPAAPQSARRRFGVKWVDKDGLKWYKENKEEKHHPMERMDKESLVAEYPYILESIYHLRMDFIFNDLGECNMDLVRYIFAKWFPKTQGNEVNIRGKFITLDATTLNNSLRIPHVDHTRLKELYIRPPYQEIRHTLCGPRSTARWAYRKEKGNHNTFAYAHLNK